MNIIRKDSLGFDRLEGEFGELVSINGVSWNVFLFQRPLPEREESAEEESKEESAEEESTEEEESAEEGKSTLEEGCENSISQKVPNLPGLKGTEIALIPRKPILVCRSVGSSGYAYNVLISALQKYLRRKEEGKMIWVATEIYLMNRDSNLEKFPELSVKQEQIVKATMTNVKNRLIIMMFEELCFDQAGIMTLARDKILKWRQNYSSEVRSKGNVLVDTSINDLILCCKLLQRGQLLRLPSDIKCWWTIGITEGYVKKPVSKKSHFEAFKNAVLNKEEEAFFYLLECYKTQSSSIWDFLRSQTDSNKTRDLITLCQNVTNTDNGTAAAMGPKKGEYHLPFIAATLQIIHQEELNWTIPKLTLTEEGPLKLNPYIKNRKTLIIDDYCEDMHTKDLKKKKKYTKDFGYYGLAHFATVGAYVPSEYKKWLSTKKRALYLASKVGLLKDSLNTEYVETIPLKDFKDISFQTEGLTRVSKNKEGNFSGNQPVVYLTYKNVRYALKLAPDDGVDQYLCDRLKPFFQLEHLNVRRVKIAAVISHIFNKGGWGLRASPKSSYFCLMDYKENIGNAGVQNRIWENYPDVKFLLLKTLLYKGLFRCTDNNERNILVSKNKDGSYRVFSIDENNLFAKDSGKKAAPTKLNWVQNSAKYYKEPKLMNKVLDELLEDIEFKIPFVRKAMENLSYSPSQIQEMTLRFKTYRTIVKDQGT